MLFKVLEIFLKNKESLWLGVRTTLLLSLLGTFLGLCIGLLIGGLRSLPLEKNASLPQKIGNKLFQFFSTLYIEIFRGTPMMVQAVFIYYALRPYLQWSNFTAALFILSINTGSYMSEIVRSGIQSVDKGQSEAAHSLGFTRTQSLFYIVLPQAIQNVFPAIANEFIVNIKDSSVLMIISITELMFQSKSIAGSNYLFVETYLMTACVYLFLTLCTSFLFKKMEKHFNQSASSYPQSQTMQSVMKFATRKVKKDEPS